jgi:hypothetical protein
LKSVLIIGVSFGGSGLIRGMASIERDKLVVQYLKYMKSVLIIAVSFGGSSLIRGMASIEWNKLVV